MNECTYKNYDELPLMLNVVQVAAVLVDLPLFFLLTGKHTLMLIRGIRYTGER